MADLTPEALADDPEAMARVIAAAWMAEYGADFHWDGDADDSKRGWLAAAQAAVDRLTAAHAALTAELVTARQDAAYHESVTLTQHEVMSQLRADHSEALAALTAERDRYLRHSDAAEAELGIAQDAAETAIAELAQARKAHDTWAAQLIAERDDVIAAGIRVLAERDMARADLADAHARQNDRWPRCPDGCGCRMDGEDSDARDCGCDGPCTMECKENGYPDALSYRDLAVTRLKADLDSARADDVELSRALMAVVSERDAWRGELATIHEMIAGPIDDPEHLAETTPRVAALIAERDGLRAEYAEARRGLEYILRASSDVGSRQDARRALAGEPQPWAREALDGGHDHA